MQYSATQLYVQLTYYQYLFDLRHAIKVADNHSGMAGNILFPPTVLKCHSYCRGEHTTEAVGRVTAPHAEAIARVHKHITARIAKNARTYVNLASIFSTCSIATASRKK